MGNDPPGQFTRVLHPRHGRHGMPPPDVIPIGRSVIVPANGTLPNIILSPRSFFRIRRRARARAVRRRAPARADDADAVRRDARRLHRADGRDVPRERRPRLDEDTRSRRGASSPTGSTTASPSPSARCESAQRWLPGEYEIVPNGVLIPPHADPAGREHRVVFAGRHENRKGLHILLQAWPEIRRRTGATLRICGADPLRVRLLMTRLRVPDDGIDVLGFLPQEQFTEELLAAKALIAPSLGGESFGIVLTRALACATPVVASDIPGYRDVMTPETGARVPARRRRPAHRRRRVAARGRAAPPGDGRCRPPARARSATRGTRSRGGSSGSTSRSSHEAPPPAVAALERRAGRRLARLHGRRHRAALVARAELHRDRRCVHDGATGSGSSSRSRSTSRPSSCARSPGEP